LADGPADFSRAGILTRADDIAGAIHRLTGVELDSASVMTEKAGVLELSRGGRVSAGGASRLVPCSDGWWALTLSRADDIAAVPALVGEDFDGDHWQVVHKWAAQHNTAEVIERSCLLGLPSAVLGEATSAAVTRFTAGPSAAPRAMTGLLVADLTSMWAGPLCGRILASAGAVVVKVESPSRPDGTRTGERAFFDLINHQKLSYAVDFTHDLASVQSLLSAADVVLEGSRPGALRRRGLSPETVPGPAGRVWLRFIGHDEVSGRVAFGDDAAVAGGLVGSSVSGPVFCGDAVADPLSGLEAALAVAESLGLGGGTLVEVSMAGVAATYAAVPTLPSASSMIVRPPARPGLAPRAPEMGAHNAEVERLVAEKLGSSC
jgi:crotonobetainyl-CoA:carnitine CoA-transferase CaiB-like acyl-CoA transferase